MPNTGRPLPIRCPECQHVGAMLIVRSLFVMTADCAKCARVRATALDALPLDIQAKVRDFVRDDRSAQP